MAEPEIFKKEVETVAKLNDYELDQIYRDFQAFKPKMLNSNTDPAAYSAMLKANNKPDPMG